MSGQTTCYTGTREKLRWLWLWGPVIIYCTLIFFWSAQQDLSPPEFPSSDKVAHFLEYGVLGVLWARAARATWPHWSFRMLLMSTVLFTGLYGWGDEWHQLYVPGRFSDHYDAGADICGGTIGGLTYLLALRWMTRGDAMEQVAWGKADVVDKG